MKNNASDKLIFSIPVHYTPSKIKITVETPRPSYVYFIGEDIANPNTLYFSRGKIINRKETVEFVLPLAPDTLKINVFTKDRTPILLHDQRRFDLTIKPFWIDAELIPLFEFVFWFAENAGFIQTKEYLDITKNHLIVYMKDIDGVTPARVNRLSGIIKASQRMMIRYSVPMRVFIMFHEICHHILPTKVEETADACALRYYLKFGFPETEANYAMTKVFGESSNRAKLLNRTITEYDFAVRRRAVNANYFFG